MKGTRVSTKMIRVFGPNPPTNPNDVHALNQWDNRNEKVVNAINWDHVVDSLNDQLPDGYYAEVSE